TSGSGFWGHITTVVNAAPGSYDYAFYPIHNDDWKGRFTTSPVMNRVFYESGIVKFSQYSHDGTPLFKDAYVIVPFPYLKYVLTKAVEFAGWTISGDPLDDDDFKKITLINFQAINWC